MRKRWLAAAVAIAAGVSWYLLLPPSPVVLPADEAESAPPIRGVMHVHTRRSDGTGTLDEVAAAAQRAGLTFVIITDHGDGTRGSDTPVYRNGSSASTRSRSALAAATSSHWACRRRRFHSAGKCAT